MNIKKIIWETASMTFATFVIAVAVFFFLVPSHAAVSSISGLAIVLANFVPFSVSEITMTLNVILLIIGFLTCGNEFGAIRLSRFRPSYGYSRSYFLTISP